MNKRLLIITSLFVIFSLQPRVPSSVFYSTEFLALAAGFYGYSSLNTASTQIAKLERKKKRILRAVRREFTDIPRKEFADGSWTELIDAENLSASGKKILKKYDDIIDEIEEQETKRNRSYAIMAVALILGGGAAAAHSYYHNLPLSLDELVELPDEKFSESRHLLRCLSPEQQAEVQRRRNAAYLERNGLQLARERLSCGPNRFKVMSYLGIAPFSRDALSRLEEELGRRSRAELEQIEGVLASMMTAAEEATVSARFRLSTDAERAEEEGLCPICFDNFGPEGDSWTTKACKCTARYHGQCALGIIKNADPGGAFCPTCREKIRDIP